MSECEFSAEEMLQQIAHLTNELIEHFEITGVIIQTTHVGDYLVVEKVIAPSYEELYVLNSDTTTRPVTYSVYSVD